MAERKDRLDRDLRAAMEIADIYAPYREMSRKVPWIDRPYPVSSLGRREQQAHRDGHSDNTGWSVFPSKQ